MTLLFNPLLQLNKGKMENVDYLTNSNTHKVNVSIYIATSYSWYFLFLLKMENDGEFQDQDKHLYGDGYKHEFSYRHSLVRLCAWTLLDLLIFSNEADKNLFLDLSIILNWKEISNLNQRESRTSTEVLLMNNSNGSK